MKAQDVAFMSDLYRTLLSEHPEWAAYFSLAHSVTFVAADGQAYRFQIAGEPDVLTQGSTVTPPATRPPEPTSMETPTATPPHTPSPCPAPLTLAMGALALVWIGQKSRKM